MFTDTYRQRETSIAMAADDCDARLVGIWIDCGQYVDPGRNQIALSIGELGELPGGLLWHPPGTSTPECPWPPRPRRFFNDCYFAGCPYTGPHTPCSSMPTTCDGYTIDDQTWAGCEPNVCAGGNGYIYAAAAMGETGPGSYALGFTRSADLGATFGPFDAGKRLKHVCSGLGTGYDRLDLAASPAAISDDVHLFWNNGDMHRVYAASSADKGDTFGDAKTIDKTEAGHELSSPAGAVDGQGNLCVVWLDKDLPGAGEMARLHCRVRHVGGVWEPAIDPHTEYQDPTVACQDFYHVDDRACPSIAVDVSSGQFYVAYAGADTEHGPERVTLITSSYGIDWSEPKFVGADTGHRQWYPEVRVEGRGNVAVSWYDTRNSPSTPAPPVAHYDIYMAYSTDQGATWAEQRVSRAYQPGAEAFFDPPLESSMAGPADYSGMAGDQRSGMSGFYILAMGCAPGVTDVQALFPYEVYLRAKGDFDGDFDLDGNDACWNTCLGHTPPCVYAPCVCRVMDFDGDCDVDWDDIGAFQNAVTGPLPGCHGVCNLNTDPPLGAGAGGWTAEEVAAMPAGCEFATWYATHASRESVLAFTARLLELMDESPELFDEPRSYEFLECIYPVLDTTPSGGG
jgi:hypothetical protein